MLVFTYLLTSFYYIQIIKTSRYESEEQIRVLSQVLWDKSNFSSENHYYDKIMDLVSSIHSAFYINLNVNRFSVDTPL